MTTTIRPYYPRLLTISVAPNGTLLAETVWITPCGDHTVLSRTTFQRFPLALVARVSVRDDYQIRIRTDEAHR